MDKKQIEQNQYYYYIYAHKFPNGKYYIGQTRCLTPETRWKKNGGGYVEQTLVNRAINKYGWENIEHFIVEEGSMTAEQANEREQYWIAFYDSYHNGYNANLGGNMITPPSAVYQLDPNTLTIIARYESTTEAARAVNGSVPCITQCCQRLIRTANKYCWCYCEDYHDGWTPRESQCRRNNRIYCLETNTVYLTPAEAAKSLGVCRVKIHEILRGESISTHGYHFCYAEDKDTYAIRPNHAATPVFCVELNKTFDSIRQVTKQIGVNYDWFKTKLRERDTVIAGGYTWRKVDKKES